MPALKRKCFVYVIAMYPDPEELRHMSSSTLAWRKVGISTNPVKRRVGIQTNLPFLVRLEAAAALPDKDCARAAEVVCHAVLANRYRSRGEWFYASHDEIEAVVSAVAKQASDKAEMAFSWYRFVAENAEINEPTVGRDCKNRPAYRLDPTGAQAFGMSLTH